MPGLDEIHDRDNGGLIREAAAIDITDARERRRKVHALHFNQRNCPALPVRQELRLLSGGDASDQKLRGRDAAASRTRHLSLSINPADSLRFDMIKPLRNEESCKGQYRTDGLNPGGPIDPLADKFYRYAHVLKPAMAEFF